MPWLLIPKKEKEDIKMEDESRMSEHIQIGNRIRKLRKNCGMTEVKLANWANITYNTLSFIENGARGITVDTLCSIAKALGVSLDQLQPEELDAYSSISSEIRELNNALNELPFNERRMLIGLFRAQIDYCRGKN